MGRAGWYDPLAFMSSPNPKLKFVAAVGAVTLTVLIGFLVVGSRNDRKGDDSSSAVRPKSDRTIGEVPSVTRAPKELEGRIRNFTRLNFKAYVDDLRCAGNITQTQRRAVATIVCKPGPGRTAGLWIRRPGRSAAFLGYPLSGTDKTLQAVLPVPYESAGSRLLLTEERIGHRGARPGSVLAETIIPSLASARSSESPSTD